MKWVLRICFGSTANPHIDIFLYSQFIWQLNIVLILWGEILSWSLICAKQFTVHFIALYCFDIEGEILSWSLIYAKQFMCGKGLISSVSNVPSWLTLYANVVVRNKVWSIWWVQIWSTLIYCHREFEYIQSCKWESIAGQNQVLILPFFSVLLLYYFTIVIISDKKILYSFIKEICSQPFSSFVLLWVLNVWLVWLVVTDFVNQFHVDLLPVLC